jgi:hypothetical protein
MLDLETWGTRPGCAIRSIGAVLFDFAAVRRQLGPGFYANVIRHSCESYGLTVDPKVEAWWAEKDVAAQAALEEPPLFSLPHALLALLRFIEENGDADQLSVWSHGATFDIPIITHAIEAMGVGLIVPWDFRRCRDTRTMIWLSSERGINIGLERVGTQHHALDDAKTRALQMIELHKLLVFQ